MFSKSNPVNEKIAASKRCACWHWCCAMHIYGKGVLGSFHVDKS